MGQVLICNPQKTQVLHLQEYAIFCTPDDPVTQPLFPKARWPRQQPRVADRKESKSSSSFGTPSDLCFPGVFPNNHSCWVLSSFSVVNNCRKRGLELGTEVLIATSTYLHQGDVGRKFYSIISAAYSPADKNVLIKYSCCYSSCSESVSLKLAGRRKNLYLL